MFFFLLLKRVIILLVISMKVLIDNEQYEVIILKKKIKNTYLRVKEDLKIYASTGLFVSEKSIIKLIKENESTIKKMIERQKKKIEKKNKFFYLGKEYKIVLCNVFKTPTIEDDTIYTSDIKKLDKFLVKEAKRIFPIRLKLVYDKMNTNIPWPKLIIRKMVRKWGHCNKRDEIVTLNTELIKYDIDEIDYVIVHELCHFIHFDHSKAFWNSVEYYKPNYKQNRKVLNEE